MLFASWCGSTSTYQSHVQIHNVISVHASSWTSSHTPCFFYWKAASPWRPTTSSHIAGPLSLPLIFFRDIKQRANKTLLFWLMMLGNLEASALQGPILSSPVNEETYGCSFCIPYTLFKESEIPRRRLVSLSILRQRELPNSTHTLRSNILLDMP